MFRGGGLTCISVNKENKGIKSNEETKLVFVFNDSIDWIHAEFKIIILLEKKKKCHVPFYLNIYIEYASKLM